MAEKKYTKQEPPINASYNEVRKFYAREEYYRRFFKRLSAALTKQYGVEEAAAVIKDMGSPHVLVGGLEEFFSSSLSPMDIGVSVAKKMKNPSFNVYLRECKKKIEKFRMSGYTNIDVFSLVSEAAKQVDLCCVPVEEASEELIKLLSTYEENPFVLKIPDNKILNKIDPSLRNRTFYSILNRMISVFYKGKAQKLKHPKIILQRAIYEDPREKQIFYLAKAVDKDNVTYIKKRLREVEELGVYSPEEIEALEEICEKRGWDKFYARGLASKSKNILKYGPFVSFPNKKYAHDFFRMYMQDVSASMFNALEVKYEFVALETLKSGYKPPILDISYSMPFNSSFETMEPHIDRLMELSILREKGVPFQVDTSRSIHRINIVNVPHPTREFLDKVSEKCRRMQSKYNKEVELNVYFKESGSFLSSGVPESEYLRVVSDIHIEINKDRNYFFDFENDFVINCGDTSSIAFETYRWCRLNMPKGIFISGNHLGYESNNPHLDGAQNLEEFNSLIHKFNTKNHQLRILQREALPKGVHFLNNGVVEKNGIYFIGTTLFTDFCLFGEENQAACMVEAARKMNDFKRCYIYNKKDKTVRLFSTEDHFIYFKLGIKTIKNQVDAILRKDPEAIIVIITHHAPTPYSVSEQYKNDPLSAAFASDLRPFIANYPNIRLWCHGHTHEKFDYIYKQCRVVCNPFGYFNENNVDPAEYGTRIRFSDIKAKKSWNSILQEELLRGDVKYYEE